MGLKQSFLALRVLLAILLAGPVQAQPVVELLTRYAVPTDETAASAPEGEAPQGSGKKLAELEADLALVSEGLEAFAHPEDAAKALLAAKTRLPVGTAPFFRDRATALDSLYRTLAVVDYTWALRFPNPPCSPSEKRGELLRSDDGLFVDRASGQTSGWMTALLGPVARGTSLEAALDRASASTTPSQAEYARLRARQSLITKALGSDEAVGEARAELYCKRAETRVRLAAANRASKQVLAARSSEAKASRQGVVIVAGKTSEGLEARGAGVVVNTKSGIRVLTDRRLGNGEVVALVDGETTPVPLTVEREDEISGLLLLRPEGDVGEALPLAEAAPEKGELVSACAHSERLGAWTRTQGLVTSAGLNQFQTDAIADASMTGGAVLDEGGRLAGLLVLRPAPEGEWPAAVPAPALNSWLAGGMAPDPERGNSLYAGTTKILTASRPLLGSISVGSGAIAAGRVADVYTPTPWGTVRGVCMANCEDSEPATSYSGGSNGNSELGEALGKLGAVALEAMIFKGIPALFRGVGSLFKSKPKASPSAALTKIVPEKKKKPLPEPKYEVRISPVRPAVHQGEPVQFVAMVTRNREDIPLSNIRVEFAVEGGKPVSGMSDSSGRILLTVEQDRPEKSHDDLDAESRRHPQLIETGRNEALGACKTVAKITAGAIGATILTASFMGGPPVIVLGGASCVKVVAASVALGGITCATVIGVDSVVDPELQSPHISAPIVERSLALPLPGTSLTGESKVSADADGAHRSLSDEEREMTGAIGGPPNDPDGPDPEEIRELERSVRNRRMTSKEAESSVKDLGFDKKIPAQKAPFNSHGKPVFQKGNKFITPDADGHNGGVWKMFNRAGQRLGTFDKNLVRIGE